MIAATGTSTGRFSGNESVQTFGQGKALDPLLARFGLVLRAAQFTGADGDPWPNEGTAGHNYDAVVGNNEPGDPVTVNPHYVTSPEPGFENTITPTLSYYYVPDGAAIEPGEGSFTAFARFYWPDPAASFDNVFAKIDTTGGPMGAGGRGWQAASGSALGGNTYAIAADGGSSFGTDPIAAGSGANLTAGEHLVVVRMDRATQDWDIFVDGVKGTTADATTVPDVTADHELIFGRGKTQTLRDYGLVLEALTDTEITVGLPAALGV